MPNNRTILSFLFVLSLSAPLLCQQPWTLQQCIDHAVAHSVSVDEARNRVAQRQIELSSAQHRYLPSAGASIDQSISLGRSADKTGMIGDQSSSSTSFGASLSWEVFSGLARPRAAEISRINLRAATAGLSMAQEQIAVQVAESYYNLLYLEEMIQVARNQLALTSETRDKTTRLVASGKWSRDKLAEIDAKLAADSAGYVKAVCDAELGRHQLALVIELPDYTQLQISAPSVASLTAAPSPELARSSEQLLEEARAARPQIVQAQLLLQSAEKQIELERSGYIPTISLQAGYNNGYYYILNESMRAYNQSFAEQMKNNGRYFVGISLSIPIFRQMQVQDQVSQAKLRYQDQQTALRRSEQELTRQVYTAHINARAAHSRIESAHRAAQAAQTALEYARISYEAGRSSSYELAEAQNRHFVAQSDELRARYEYLYRVFILRSYLLPPSEQGQRQ